MILDPATDYECVAFFITNTVLNPNALYLPKNIVINIVNSESKIESLKQLIGSKYIGMSSAPMLFTLSDEDKVFLIDLKRLGTSKPLDLVLRRILTDSNTLSIGYNFIKAQKNLKRKFPYM